MAQTYNAGLSSMGSNVWLTKYRDQYLAGEINQKTLIETGETYIEQLWQDYQRMDMDILTVGDIYWHDPILCQSLLVGAIPDRFATTANAIQLGSHLSKGVNGIKPCARKNLFDSSYQYVVPEIGNRTAFRLWDHTFFAQIARARELGYQVKPTLLGPASYLFLAQHIDEQQGDCSAFLNALLPVYLDIFEKISNMGIEWIQLEEPMLSTELNARWMDVIMNSMTSLSGRGLKILLTSHGSILNNAEFIKQLPYEGIHLDCISDPNHLNACKKFLDSDTVLSLAILDGATALEIPSNNAVAKLRPIADKLGEALWLTISYSNGQKKPNHNSSSQPSAHSDAETISIFDSMEQYNQLQQIKTIFNNPS